MAMYKLIEYSDNYSKTSEILWQYCRDGPAINATDGDILYFNAANATTNMFKIKEKTAFETGDKNAGIIVPLKYLSNFWRILKMSLINCEVSLDINWSKKCAIVATVASRSRRNIFNN